MSLHERAEPCYPLRGALRELPSYLWMATSIMATMTVDLCNSSACVAVAGRIFAAEPQILAAVSVGSMLFNICLLSTSYGMASGLDTLLPQAHGAVAELERRQRGAMEISAHRSRLPSQSHPGRAHVRWTVMLLGLVWLPLGAICIFSEPVLRIAGQPAGVAVRAGKFARVLTVAAGVPLVCRTVQAKVINTARVTWPPLLGGLVGSMAHFLFLYALYAKTSARHSSDGAGSDSGTSTGSVLFDDAVGPLLGWTTEDAFLGTALGRAVYAITSVTVAGLYLLCTQNAVCPSGCCVSCTSNRGVKLLSPVPSSINDIDDVAAPLARQANVSIASEREQQRVGLCVVASLAVPSMLSMIAEWWAAECRALIAGWVDSSDVTTIIAANGVVFMFTVVYYQVPKGLGIAASVRCGNALGAGSAFEAQRAAYMGLATTGLVSLVCAGAYYSFAARFLLGLLATNDAVLGMAVDT
eukprot:SAG31_NODE_3369_length_4354_cov_4.327380_3_plen_469_part_00